MRDGALVKWVTATGRAHKRSNKHIGKHAFTHTHTHKMTVPSCVPMLAFPARPQITQAQHTGNTPLLHFARLSSALYPGFWVKGIWHP